jgi:flagellar biosynthesis/type III secretory pathway M-ring protein FliF/YscJ
VLNGLLLSNIVAKRAFEQTKANRHLSQVQGNLTDIHRVMQRSLSDVVNRGEDISALGFKSDQVLAESESYRKVSADLNRMKLWQKWGVVIVIVVVLALVFYIRSRFF